jgi:hypothetical protein
MAALSKTKKQNKTKLNKTKQNKTKQNKTKQNKTKQNKTKQNKTKQNKTKQKTKNTGGFLSRYEYENIDELLKTSLPNKAETFKIECIDYDYEYDKDITVENGRMVQVGEITFSKNDIIPIENNEEGRINKPFIYKTAYTPAGKPYESSNIFMPKNSNDVELRFNNKYFSLYDKGQDRIIKKPVSLIRTTGQLLMTTGNKLMSSFMPKSNVTNTIPQSNVTST